MAKRKSSSSSKNRKNTSLLHRILTKHRNLTAALLIVLLFGTAGTVWYLRNSGAASTDIDTTNQAAVNTAYWGMWDSAFSQYSNWTGSVSTCKAGSISDDARRAQNRAVNFARRLNGLTPVWGVTNDTTVAGVQKAALMMEANGKLSHNPDKSWKCYTAAGDTAAGRSNLFLSSVTAKTGSVIKGYMDDSGSSNTAVGHRRWLLNPDAAAFAYGMSNKASALQVIGTPTDTANANPAWVTWPSRNWFPAPAAPARWSLSSGNNKTLFGSATIKVTRNGVSVPVTKHKVHDGYAKPTLVWDMPSGYERTGKYVVQVQNIKRSDSTTIYSYQYAVNFFTPTK